MTVLAQNLWILGYRLMPSLVVAAMVALGIGIALVALIAGLQEFAELTSPLDPYGPGAPDLEPGSIA